MSEHIEPPRHIRIAPSHIEGAGRGVFADAHIREGALIERCPVVALGDPRSRDHLRKTELVNYYFLWGDGRIRTALCLGWGSIYNHSFTPNARYEKLMDEALMDFYAIRDIEAGEEITVNYNGDPSDIRQLNVPGIPVHAGGPLPSKLPRVLGGLRRRMLLLWRAFFGHGSVNLLAVMDIPLML